MAIFLYVLLLGSEIHSNMVPILRYLSKVLYKNVSYIPASTTDVPDTSMRWAKGRYIFSYLELRILEARTSCLPFKVTWLVNARWDLRSLTDYAHLFIEPVLFCFVWLFWSLVAPRDFLSYREWGCSSLQCETYCGGALVAEHSLWGAWASVAAAQLSSCGSWALEHGLNMRRMGF